MGQQNLAVDTKTSKGPNMEPWPTPTESCHNNKVTIKRLLHVDLSKTL